MMRFEKSRRRFLQSLLSTSVVAPLSLGGMTRLATAAGAPKLKVVFAVIPDGFATDSYGGFSKGLWFPNANGATDTSAFTLNELSSLLGEHSKKSLFLKQLIVGSGTGGHNAWTTILRDSNASKTSIDLILADALPGANPALKRLYSGPHAMVGASWNVSYQNGTMLLPEDNPYTLHKQVMGASSGGSSGGSSDRSYLFEPAMVQLNALRSKLTGSEKTKLDDHLGAVEQVAADMRATLPPTAECDANASAPTAGMDINSADFRDEVTRAHINILAAGLSCGSSRVATLQIGRSADQVVIKSVSSSRNPHDCAHRYGSVDEWKNSRAWYVKQVKYLLDRLALMPDPDVSGDKLLDHTLVVFTSEMADGAPEHMQDVPVTLIGGASGLLKSGNGAGRFYDLKAFGERDHWAMGKAVDMQRVWATIAKAAGTTVPYGGDISVLPNIFSNVS